MSRADITITAEGRINASLGVYQFPPDTGNFIGPLTYRTWHLKKQCLICYFDTDSGEHLNCWLGGVATLQNHILRKMYCNFATGAVDGSRWKCDFVNAKVGSITWVDANEISPYKLYRYEKMGLPETLSDSYISYPSSFNKSLS